MIIFYFRWACTHLKVNLQNQIINLGFQKKQLLIDIITSIEFLQWNKAKSIWVLHFLFDDFSIDCDCDDSISVFSKTKTISIFGSEFEVFLEPNIQIQE